MHWAFGDNWRHGAIVGLSRAPTMSIVLIGTIRPVETRSLSVEAHSLAEAHELLEAQRPEGFDLANVPVQMGKGTTLLTAIGTYVRRDGVKEIEAADRASLDAQVPDGWALITVRSV